MVPLAVAAIGAGVPLMAGAGPDGEREARRAGGPAGPSVAGGARLVVEDMAVTDDNGDGVDLIDLTLRNDGGAQAVVDRIGLRVRRTAMLEGCVPAPQPGGGPAPSTPTPAPGPLEPSHRYQVELPAAPPPGLLVRAKVSHRLPPGTVDRFTLKARAPRARATTLFVVDVLVHHGDAAQPLPAGGALVALPSRPTFARLGGFGPAACRATNRRRAARSLSGSPQASPELLGLLQDV